MLKEFWYPVACIKDLKENRPLGVEIFDEWIAIFLDSSKNVVAVEDRCLHRNARLSKGKVVNGELTCPYHGWRYCNNGQLSSVPSEGPKFTPSASKCIKSFETYLQDGYIYLKLKSSSNGTSRIPFKIPYLGANGYKHIRLSHKFRAQVPNCAENFIDIPHTTFVHPNIFRYEQEPQLIQSDVELKDGNVHVRYLNETSNFGIFSKFLNSKSSTIFHEDNYYFPNITHVEYRFSEKMHFNITSQSVQVTKDETMVYTDLTYNYGFWNLFAKPFVRWVGKKIIAQDVDIMRQQSDVTAKYGQQFLSMPSDIQHVFIELIYDCLRNDKDPTTLPNRQKRVDFWI